MIETVTIIGTGLIGTSIALGLRKAGFEGRLIGLDRDEAELSRALAAGPFSEVRTDRLEEPVAAGESQVIVLAVPVLAILAWMERLAPLLTPEQLVTDVGSTKLAIARQAMALFNQAGRATFLPGHPMAGKEMGGAALGEATLFDEARWLFTPVTEETALTEEWRGWVERMGARTRDLEPERHDAMCAWVSHLPQFVATALAAVLEERFGDDPDVVAVGGRALAEMTRLGASPFSMWRDVAYTNVEPIAVALQALEQELAHLRENLKTPELRREFTQANAFRQRRDG